MKISNYDNSVAKSGMNNALLKMVQPKVIILVLNWNRKELSLECIKSLLSINYANYKIILIDNGSLDGSEDAIKNSFPSVVVIQNGDNLGYAGGNNEGIKWAVKNNAEYVLILNNDTRIHKDCIYKMISIAENHSDEKIAILGPVAYDYDDNSKLLARQYWFDWNLLKPKYSVDGINVINNSCDSYWYTECVRGDCILIKKEVFDKIGFFDERYFLYNEELDFCHRARVAGYRSAIVDGAKYFRKSGTSLGGNVPLFFRYMSRNSLLFFFKNASVEQKKRWQVKLLKSLKWEVFGYHLPKYFASKNPMHIKNIIAVLMGYSDYFLRRFGKINS